MENHQVEKEGTINTEKLLPFGYEREEIFMCGWEISKWIPKHLNNGKFESNWILNREVT